MADMTMVARFPFVANKSFASAAHPITVPARFQQAFKAAGVTESTNVKISFRKEPVVDGAIRSGFRAGGRYYQITSSRLTAVVDIGTQLMVRVSKTAADTWLIEID